MIEKIMKAVKSSNKKRGRNITVGAVVGMLLSCTAVMGAGEIGLDIKKGDGGIEFSKDGTSFDPNDLEGPNNPYPENIWDNSTKTYTNNTTIFGRNESGESSGIKIENLDENITIKNNGNIYGYAKNTNDTNAYGIQMNNGKIENNGIISGYQAYVQSTYGIKTSTGKINNNGAIFGHLNQSKKASNMYSYGIYIDSGSSNIVNNNGNIYGIIIDSTGGPKGQGIYIESGKVSNNGSIYTCEKANQSTTAVGIEIRGGAIANSGIVSVDKYRVIMVYYGSENKIINNYGIFLNCTGSDIFLEGKGVTKNNYGLYITNGNTVAMGSSLSPGEQVIFGYADDGSELKRDMTIENSDSTTDTGSFTGNKDNVILNKLKNTYTATDNTIIGSVINSYGKAITFDEAGGSLTLSGTIVNGGLDNFTSSTPGRTEAIMGSDKGDTLILKAGDITVNESEVSQNTIINGNINMGEGSDTLTIEKGTIINGLINGGKKGSSAADEDTDTLNFIAEAKTKTVSNSEKGINVLYNISNFENINIDTDVTFFDKTVYNNDLTDNSLKVTEVKSLVIKEKGNLILKVDGTRKDSPSGNIIGHALATGNTGGTITSEGGKLLLALNGVSDGSTINIGMTLDDTMYGTENPDIKYRDQFTLDTTSLLYSLIKTGDTLVKIETKSELPLFPTAPDGLNYVQLNKIYQSMRIVDGVKEFDVDDDAKLSTFLGYLNDIYAGNPYSYSSELSRKSAGMFRDIVTENIFRPETNKWMIYGGLTHVDGGTKDTYYGKGYYTTDIGSSDMDADTKITGAYMLGEYGISDTLTSGVVIGGNKLKSDLSNGSKVDGSAMYLGAYAKKYVGNLKVTAGAGFQYGDYDADRIAVNKVASSTAESVMKYSDNYNDITYDIYLNGRYSHNIGDNLFLEPYATLSYTYVDQDGANEGSKVLAIETDSKSFDYTVGKVGVDLKKVIPHEKGKSTLSAGISYTKILDGADEEHITGRFKGGSDFDILVAHKNEHSIGLNAKYALELENGVLFDVKGTYSVERDSHNNSGKNRTKGEWIVGAGIGYKF
ncbi:hypothetical protein M2102_001422 [Fusobacterium sp. PH5-7]|uniref:autotransporter family protein n=1 Tax=Fusobacterium sp. PH5-7 TaxID=2940528 RepID=UPI002475838D|nr:autotransporter outer membrane beta-barrel domain-containing protein [Fusobacterium sp. PH5-7]MDH6457793.1 hypothetical protein [Fusobacterium sp. PH5-7]